ncbi:MAG: serine/threonine-protein kinase [Terriglobales bacterium]
MIGNQIANFRIVDKLGEGGMGVVFRAVDVQLDRPVAIKMLNADLARDPQVVERFRAEARAQANLNHVNLATLYAFLVDQGNAFMVMEFVEGETFEQIINRRGPIPPEDAVPWFKQALLGIGAAHRMGIIHRDIKPSNLMLNRQGIVKVMDFGIAKVVGARGMTRTGMQLGTLPYMSPEQIQNRNVDMRTDIYALGITLYQMLSGHVPFESDSDFEIMNGHITAPPPPLTRMYPYAPVQYENVVMKALEKNPDNRTRRWSNSGRHWSTRRACLRQAARFRCRQG